jgi:ribosomal protein S1
MKKVLLSMVAVATIAMTSCGGNEFCECFEMGQEKSKKMQEAGGDADKVKAIEEEYKSQTESCDKSKDAFKESVKDLKEEEKEAKMKELEDSCPAYKTFMEEMKG